MNDGIKLIVIIEHVMGYKKYVIPCFVMLSFRASWSSTAPEPWITSLKFDKHSFHYYWVYDDDIAVTDFLDLRFFELNSTAVLSR